jgi:hypothetical protein
MSEVTTTATTAATIPAVKEKKKRVQIPTNKMVALCAAMHVKKPKCTLEDLQKCVKKNFGEHREIAVLSSLMSGLRSKVKSAYDAGTITEAEFDSAMIALTFETTGGRGKSGVSFVNICRTIPSNVSESGEVELIAPDTSNGMALDFDLDF